MNEWINVKDRLPEMFKYVICFCPEKDYGSKIVVDYAETDGGFAERIRYGKTTHWMPLPEPPKED